MTDENQDFFNVDLFFSFVFGHACFPGRVIESTLHDVYGLTKMTRNKEKGRAKAHTRGGRGSYEYQIKCVMALAFKCVAHTRERVNVFERRMGFGIGLC